MILVAGSANLDFTVRAPHIPAPGETVLGQAFATQPGGKGANQAVACARAGGVATAMLVALGDDAFAAPIEASLREAGVALHVVRAHGQPTGAAFICVDDNGENAITVAPGANTLLRPEDLPSLDGMSHLLLQLETPIESVTAWAIAAHAAGVTVVLNAAPARALPRELLAAIDVLIVNEGELAAIAGVAQGDVDAALARIDVPCIVVTLGRKGCRARCDGEALDQAAFTVRPVDTTAAGDTFCGVLVAARARGATWPVALREASAAAAIACTRPGAQASVPTVAEVKAFLRAVKTA
jgi:ribokinase